VKTKLKFVFVAFRRVWWWCFWLQAVVFLVAATWIQPADLESGRIRLTKPCPVKVESGDDCGTCGVTRGIAAMGSLQWKRAYRYNPIAVWIYLAQLGVVAWGVRRIQEGRKPSD